MSYAVGLMSGTSLDGVDAALVEINNFAENTEVKLIDFLYLEYPEEIKEKIKSCCSKEESNVELICSLNFELGYIFADAVKGLCKKAMFHIDKLDFIGSHGQTIFHMPTGKEKLYKADTIVCAVAQKSLTSIVDQLRDTAPEFYYIGDCVKPQRVKDAVSSGYHVAMSL